MDYEKVKNAAHFIVGVVVFGVMFYVYQSNPFPEYLFLIPGAIMKLDLHKFFRK